MKAWFLRVWRVWLLLLVIGAMLVVALGTQPPPGYASIDTAQAVLMPDGGPIERRAVSLPHRWDSDFPGRGGRAIYTLDVPLDPKWNQPGLLFPRLGNQAEIRMGGKVLWRAGKLGDPSFDRSRSPALVSLPPWPSGIMRIEIEITAQPMRWGGVGRPIVSSMIGLHPAQRWNTIWRFNAAIVLELILGVCLLWTLILWAVLRNRIFALLSVSILLGLLCYGDMATESPLIPWPWWGWMVEASIVPHWLLLQLALLRLAGMVQRRFTRLFYAAAVLGALLPVAGQASGDLWLWMGSLLAAAAFALILPFVALRRSLRRGQARAVAVTVICVVSVGLAAVHVLSSWVLDDWPVLILAAPFGILVLLLSLSWLLVSRYTRIARRYRVLVRRLDEKVAQRERELAASHDEVLRLVREQERATERARILRDMHDGVGTHLSSAIRQLQAGPIEREGLLQTLRDSLDQLKLTIDATRLPPGDIPSLLANLRHRLEPRLKAAGIALEWDVDAITPLPGLDAEAMRQLQYMVFEVISNVLQHAQAHTLRVRAKALGDGAWLSLEDDGCGIAPEKLSRVQSVGALHERARLLKAQLRVHSAPGEQLCSKSSHF